MACERPTPYASARLRGKVRAMTTSLDFLMTRRSAGTLAAPGPSRAQLDQLLQAAGTVPDHGRLRPFRFAVIEGEGLPLTAFCACVALV